MNTYKAIGATFDRRFSNIDTKHATLESLLSAELAVRPRASYDAAENILTDGPFLYRILDCCGLYELRAVALAR